MLALCYGWQMTILEIQNNFIAEFSKLATWEERYQHVIALGKTLPPFPEDKRTESNKVKGCQSQVWMHAHFVDGKVKYHIDSDAMIVKGLAAILYQTFNAQNPSDILAASMDFLEKIGFTSHLSQSRANGLAAMARQFKNYALVFQTLQKTR